MVTTRKAAPTAVATGLEFRPDVAVQLRVNGVEREVTVPASETLLDWLRESESLTGIKKGCNEGACGTCTVLVDGARVNGCLMLVSQCEGRQVTTIEGLADTDGTLHPVQRAFLERDGFQCGYCTPGQVLSAVACIAEGHAGSAAEVREWMSGNLCRCASYPQITAAVLDAAAELGSGATR